MQSGETQTKQIQSHLKTINLRTEFLFRTIHLFIKIQYFSAGQQGQMQEKWARKIHQVNAMIISPPFSSAPFTSAAPTRRW